MNIKFISNGMKKLIYLIFLFTPFFVSAELVSCNNCNMCDLITTIDKIVKFLTLDLALPVAIIAFIISGIMLMTASGNPQQIEKGRKIFGQVFIGLIIAFGAWLFVNTILGSLMAGEFKVWNTFPECRNMASSADYVPGPYSGTAPSEPVITAPASSGAIPTGEAERKALLESRGVKVWHSDTGVTELAGLREPTVQVVIDLAQAIGPLQLNSGSEKSGHNEGKYSHANGYKIDIQSTPAIDNYIQKYLYIGTRSGDNAPTYTDGKGNYYYREKTIWDIGVGTAFPILNNPIVL